MKVLVFVIIAASFTSVCFAQNCGLVEADADVKGTDTWQDLTIYLVSSRTDPFHWKKKEAKYYINHSSCPLGGVAAINAAASTWTSSSWKGTNEFRFISKGDIPNFANKRDGKNVIAFQPLPSANTNTLARTGVSSS